MDWRWGAKAWGANRIRYPGSPRCKRCALGVGVRNFSTEANAISAPPGEYARQRWNSKGIDRGPAQSGWSMWFNSMIREEPYQGLDIIPAALETALSHIGTVLQVLHGCRQLVLWSVGLSPATSATLLSVANRWSWGLRRNCRWQTGGKGGDRRPNHHGLMSWGYTRCLQIGPGHRVEAKPGRWERNPEKAGHRPGLGALESAFPEKGGPAENGV